MTLNFTISENDILAFTKEYYRGSASHMKARRRSRWGVPIMLGFYLAVLHYFFEMAPVLTAVIVVLAVGWIVLHPKRIDARIRRFATKQMGESSFAKQFGAYVLTLEDEHLVIDSPTGIGNTYWNILDRVELSDDYLFVFLAGPSGVPIPIEQVGKQAAHSAYDRMNMLMENAKLSGK